MYVCVCVFDDEVWAQLKSTPFFRYRVLVLVDNSTTYPCVLTAVDFDSSDHDQLTNSSPECVGSPTQTLSPTVM